MNLFMKTLGLRFWTLGKVPMLFLSSPVIEALEPGRCEISIKLRYLTKNHFNCMYLGALVGGADLASGLLAMEISKEYGGKVGLIFKNLSGNFHKRAEGRTHFICDSGDAIRQGLKEACETGERRNVPVVIKAYCPDLSPDCVADFAMTISLKKRS